jgi:hypothetical protein
MAGKSSITESQVEIIIECMLRNCPRIKAAEKAGVCEKTFYNWMNQGEFDLENGIETLHSHLYKSVRSTEADRIMILLDRVEQGKRGWQGSAWVLERRYKEFFGRDSYELEVLKSNIDALRAQVQQIINPIIKQ